MLNKKNVLVLGLGKTGISIINFILKHYDSCKICATDSKMLNALPQEFLSLKNKIFRLSLGEHKKEDFDWADIIFASPGIDLSKLSFAPTFSKEIINDIELAYRYLDSNFIGITGSNGKSTTTKLIYELILSEKTSTIMGGNYGIPILSEIIDKKPENLVCELSSFQLENIAEFSPTTSVFLNLSEDHLDRYASYEDYIKAKENIFINATSSTNIIYNLDDKRVAEIVNCYPGKKYAFSWTNNGAITSNGNKIKIIHPKLENFEIDLTKCSLQGNHHIENMMAAILVATLNNISSTSIQNVIDNFIGIPHRNELVRELNGVKFYNDSKATNVGATLKALEGFKNKIILIAGGKDKGGSLDDLSPLIKEKVKQLLLIGEASDKFYTQFSKITNCVKCKTLDEAVNKSWELSLPGDTVLLSPACSSYDMFKNFEERGDNFKKSVYNLS